jgi:hypothetical protein
MECKWQVAKERLDIKRQDELGEDETRGGRIRQSSTAARTQQATELMAEKEHKRYLHFLRIMNKNRKKLDNKGR